jgi:acyl-CoA reductase-like NAD-dependent aldehyde dehydrogenase
MFASSSKLNYSSILRICMTEVIDMANDTSYGLACAVFTQNVTRAITTAHGIEAGTAWASGYILFVVTAS